MQIKKITCPACGAPLNLAEQRDNYQCPYCGSTLDIQENLPPGSTTETQQVNQAIRQLRAQISRQLEEIHHQEETFRTRLPEFIPNSQIQPPAATPSSAGQPGRSRTPPETITPAQDEWITGNTPLPAVVSTTSGTGEQQSSKNWTVVFFLCLVLGVFGAHRFYTGYYLVGLIQLFTGGGFLVWWLIDLVQILSNKYQDSAGRLVFNPQAPLLRGCASAILVFAILTLGCSAGSLLMVEELNGQSQIQSNNICAISCIFLVVGVIGSLWAFFYTYAPKRNLLQQIKDRIS